MTDSVERRILQELVYERVRSSVNLCQLVVLEQDLDRSVERILTVEESGNSPSSQAIARLYVEEAWRRLEREWSQLRRDLRAVDAPAHAGAAEPA